MRTRAVSIAVALLAVACTASACGVLADTTAATVAGRSVSVSDVETLSRDEALVGGQIPGVGESRLPGDLFRNVLSFELQRAALLGEVERWGLEITDADRETAEAGLEVSEQQSGTTYAESTRPLLVEFSAAQSVLQERLSRIDPTNEDDLRLLYEGSPVLWDRVCVAVVELTEELSGEVRDALDEGAEVEELPERVEGVAPVVDPSQGCVPRYQVPVQLAEQFEAAEVGEVVGPVTVGDPATGQGTFVFRVEGTRSMSFDDASEELPALAQQVMQPPSPEQAGGLARWLGFVVAGAEIDPRYGSGVTVGPTGQPVVAAPAAPLVPAVEAMDPMGGGAGATP